jgi:hypothetical protein
MHTHAHTHIFLQYKRTYDLAEFVVGWLHPNATSSVNATLPVPDDLPVSAAWVVTHPLMQVDGELPVNTTWVVTHP